MKNLNTYLFLILMSLLTLGCESLDEVPYSFTSVESLYQNEDDVDAALLGIYQPLTLDGVSDLFFFLTLSGGSENFRVNQTY